jgi:hypothetical protein
MKFPTPLKLAAAAIATGALLVPGIGPAQAGVTYPPHVSVLYASPLLSGGYASIFVSGTDLTSGMTVQASRGSKMRSASVYVDFAGTTGSALVKVSSLLPKTAGRYSVDFALTGGSLAAAVTTTQTYTVGKAISIKSLNVTRKSYGLYITGKAAKKTPVKITIEFGSKTYTKTVKARSSGYFSYKFHKTSKGTYTITAKVASNRKYFSDAVSTTYTRS